MTNVKENKNLITLSTKSATLSLDRDVLEKEIGKKVTKLLMDAIDTYTEIVYAKLEKKVNPTDDYLLFYSPKLCNYVQIKISSLAKAVVVEEEHIKKFMPKQKVGEPAKTKKQLQQDRAIALLAFTGNVLFKGLKRVPLFAYYERMYWIDFAISKLGAIPPKTEEEIDERLIKTYKIYAIAYYIQHRPPVAITRTLLNSLNFDCNYIEECVKSDRASILTSVDTEVYSGKSLKTKTSVQVDVKCQSVYPTNPYGVSNLILGHNITKVSSDGKCLESSKVAPHVDDNVTFVVKRTEKEYTYGRGGKCKSAEVNSSLVTYIPTTKPEEYATNEFTIQDLVATAYQIAISINYVISRVNFK